MTIKCKSCKTNKPVKDYLGPQHKVCNECRIKFYYPSSLSSEVLKKTKVRSIFANAVAAGTINRPSVCSVCLADCKPEGHHPSYDHPLEVVWMCRQCHRDLHRSIIQPPRKSRQSDPAA